MQLHIDFDKITQLFHMAHSQGRDHLFEYEVYQLLADSGAETPPARLLIPRDGKVDTDAAMAIPGDRAVLKIVSPTIVHKTEVGGVRIVPKEENKIRSAVRRMLYEVPENYAQWLGQNPSGIPASYAGLEGEQLVAAISNDIEGVLQVQFMPPDSEAFGNELIVGLRFTREFGMVLSAGLGGTDTELYADRFRKGQAIVAASCALNDGKSFFALFKRTISYRKLAGLTRGQRRIVTDEQLIECFESFIQMGHYYSPENPLAPFVIRELEINPFAFTDYLMVPLDGLCKFGPPPVVPRPRPLGKIDNLLHPKRIGIMGVSATRKNFGRIILDNILVQGFDPRGLCIIKPGLESLDGIPCVPDLAALEAPLDLFIVAVGAHQVPDLIESVMETGAAQSVMLIPGGMGETADSRERADQVMAQIAAAHGKGDGGPVFLGANCMGVISHPGAYDTWFIPGEKLPKNRDARVNRAALISQSGAFMLHRTHQCPQLAPAYAVSMGNQTDLTLGDMVSYFAEKGGEESGGVDVIAVYAEGFNDLDGLAFCRAVERAVAAGKEVIFYKAGRTPEGKAATGSHTASLAGDYMVCESCVAQAGAIVARNFTEFQDLFLLAETLHGKIIGGNRLAAVSGAGFEAVGMADSIQCDDFSLELAEPTPETWEKVGAVLREKHLDALVTPANPLDINPGADDDAHARVTEILARDPGVDALVVSLDPLSPAVGSLDGSDVAAFDMNRPGSIKELMVGLCERIPTPVLAVVDGGRLYDPLRDALMGANIPVFPVCDRAVVALGLYVQGRLRARDLRDKNNEH